MMTEYPIFPPMTNASSEFSFLQGKVILTDGSIFCRYLSIKLLADRLASCLAENRMQLCLARSAEAEIARQIEDPSTEPSYRRSLQSALQFIRAFDEAGLIKLLGSEGDSSAETFLKYIMLNRTGQGIVMLTQQKWLYEDISALNNLRTVKAPEVIIRRLNNDGFLEPFQEIHRPTTSDKDQRKPVNQPISDALIRLGLA